MRSALNSTRPHVTTSKSPSIPSLCNTCTHRYKAPQICQAGVDPALMQDILVGGAVIGAVGSALYSGLKKDPVVCDLCQGTGGIKCFACSGDGKRELISRDSMYETQGKRDSLGRTSNPRQCRVCQGTGLVLCSKCKGNGYMSTM